MIRGVDDGRAFYRVVFVRRAAKPSCIRLGPSEKRKRQSDIHAYKATANVFAIEKRNTNELTCVELAMLCIHVLKACWLIRFNSDSSYSNFSPEQRATERKNGCEGWRNINQPIGIIVRTRRTIRSNSCQILSPPISDQFAHQTRTHRYARREEHRILRSAV